MAGAHVALSWAKSTRTGSNSWSRSIHSGTMNRLVGTAPPELARVLGAPVVGRAVHRLAGEHHPAGVGLHDERLMPRRVAGRRHDPDPLGNVGFSPMELVSGIGEVVEAHDRIVLLAVRRIELDLLREDRRVREARIPTTVVEVQVAVHDDPDLVCGHAGRGERLVQGAPNGMVELLHLLVTVGDAGVEENKSVRMIDQITAHHDLLAGPRIPIVGDREMTEEDAPDAVEVDHVTAL